MKKALRILLSVSVASCCLRTVSVFAQNSIIESLTGPVTTNEVSSIKSAIAGLVPGESNHRNNYAYGNSGRAMEACGDMFDVTKDRVFLDKLVHFCDKVVSIRNTNRVMWTGHIDPVWPNNTNNIWGCEQGDVAGHLAYCAQLISQHPALWDRPVGVGDATGYGETYRARAMNYLAVVDETMELFYKHDFIHADEVMQTPPTPIWPDPRSAGDAVPWNQQGMICSALLRSADAHALFNDGNSHIAKFRNTAKASANRFIISARSCPFSCESQ